MQKNNITEDFDLFVKGSLLDAEEKPSPRVWQAIESRLDAATAPAAGSFRWGWVAFAAAAAVAAVLLIPNSNSGIVRQSGEHQVLAQAAAVETPAIPSARQIVSLPARSGRVENTFAAAEEAVNAVDAARTDDAQEEIAGLAVGDVTQSESFTGNDEVLGEVPAAGATPVVGGNEDPFAAMAFEDSRKAPRKILTAAYIGGTMGGNESSSGGAAYAAKSSNPAYIENSIVESSASNYGIPVSLGAGVKFGMGEKLSFSAGIDYSYLSRSFTGTYSPAGSAPVSGEISHEMRYAGIPVGVYYNLIHSGSVNFYVLGLAEAEWCLGNRYSIRGTATSVSEKVSGAQFSAGGGFGVDFNLSKLLSIYVDPTVRYYFDCGHPGNIRSEKQFMLNFNAGVRFNLF